MRSNTTHYLELFSAVRSRKGGTHFHLGKLVWSQSFHRIRSSLGLWSDASFLSASTTITNRCVNIFPALLAPDDPLPLIWEVWISCYLKFQIYPLSICSISTRCWITTFLHINWLKEPGYIEICKTQEVVIIDNCSFVQWEPENLSQGELIDEGQQ